MIIKNMIQNKLKLIIKMFYGKNILYFTGKTNYNKWNMYLMKQNNNIIINNSTYALLTFFFNFIYLCNCIVFLDLDIIFYSDQNF